MFTVLLGFLAFDKKSREFKKFRKELLESDKAEAKRVNVNEDSLFGPVSKGIRNRTIRASISYGDVSPKFVELAQTILELPPQVGAFLSTLELGVYLLKNGLSLWGQGELMIVYESMAQIDPKKARF